MIEKLLQLFDYLNFDEFKLTKYYNNLLLKNENSYLHNSLSQITNIW